MKRLGNHQNYHSQMTWEDAFNRFKLRCESQNLSRATMDQYEIQMRLWKRWCVGEGVEKPFAVEASHLRAYLLSRKESGVSDNTVDLAFRSLRTLWRFLLREELIENNPMDKVERPRREKKLIKTFTHRQFQDLLKAIDRRRPVGKRDFAIIQFLADTGLRLSEVVSLKLDDVDMKACTLRVLGKGRKERVVPFGKAVHKSLSSWLRLRGKVIGEKAFWLSGYQRPMKKRDVQDRMKAYGRKAGITDVRVSPHTLRHFFAVNFLRNGGNVFVLQRILGHASLEMTRRYAQMSDEDVKTQHLQASPMDRLE